MAKREKRRLRKNKNIKSRRRFLPMLNAAVKLLPYLILIGVLFSLFKGAYNLLLYSRYFDIKKAEVIGDGPVETMSSLLDLLNSNRGTNIFRHDIKGCEYAIEQAHHELKDVVVHRRLPDTLLVSYKLRRPVCQISSGYYYLVSDDAVIISRPQISMRPGLIVVSGIRVGHEGLPAGESHLRTLLKRAIGVIKDIDGDYRLSGDNEITQIDIHDINSPALILKCGTRIELGRHRFKDKSETVQGIIKELNSRNRKARVIDLRFEDVVVVPGQD
jgi:cell division septal protein FtsQ